MAKSGDMLREFLIGLGFEINPQEFAKFQEAQTSTLDLFKKLAEAAFGAAIAVGALAVKVASDMEELYFSSERAGSSIRGLMALRFGGAQAGIGADAMSASIEQMASAIRSNPGLVAFFKQLGLPVMADNTKNFTNMINALRELDARGGGVLARMIGAQFGFDEQTLTLLFKNYPDFIRGLKEQNDLLAKAGINADEFGKRSHEAMENWRVMLLHLKTLGDLLAVEILPAVDKLVVFLTRAIDLVMSVNKAVWGVVGSVVGGGSGTIAGAEGFSSKVYRDVAGNPTIGYGHLVRPGEDFSGGITQAGAVALLAQDTAAAQDAIFRLVKVALNSNQGAALRDLMFNVGPGALAQSTLLKKLNSGDYAGAGDEFLRWNQAMVNGHLQTVPGLTSRRIADRDLFNKPVSLSQTTNIRIEGVTDPREAGQVVASHQTRINGDLVRNLSGAVQ